MKHNIGILWFRNDLRLHDHEALQQALSHCQQIIPVYCLDPEEDRPQQHDFPKRGEFRRQFLLESLANLRQNLRALGSDLVYVEGNAAHLLPELAQAFGATAVYGHAEIASEELAVESELEKALFPLGIGLELFWGSSLYHLADLPMPVQALPEVFTHFRKQVEKYSSVRSLIPHPTSIPTPPISDPGELPIGPALAQRIDARSVLPFEGGESAALTRLKEYVWKKDLLKTYKETRNGLLGGDYSSKFSPWLAHGCLSPRMIYWEAKRYEQERVKNSSTYWLVFELIWRDFFRFITKKHGNALFLPGGIKGEAPNWREDERLFTAWQEGMTGIPFVDANMRELKETGFMSNRGRQNVASFLVHDLRQDWRKGAAYFESQLIDYDVCSNWGNWNYVAGVGNDPRDNRYFNLLSQVKRYDPKGAYLRHWIPELSALPNPLIFEPGSANQGELRQYGISLGADYPYPVVDFSTAR